VALCLVVVTFFSPRLLPYNMDEFISYHQLGCFYRHDTSQTVIDNLQIEGCHKYDLRLPHTSQELPLRSFGYVGSLPGLVYYPFFAIIHSPISERLQGLVFLLLACYLMARLLRVRYGHALLAVVLFPIFAFSFIADTGPVGLPIVLLLSTLLIIRRGFEATSKQTFGYLALAGFVSFLNFWIKPTFSWWLPVIFAYLFFWPAFVHIKKRRKFDGALGSGFRSLSFYLVGFLPLTLLLLATVDRDGSFYLQYLQATNQHIRSLHELGVNVRHLLPFFFNGNHISSVVVVIKSAWEDLIPVVLMGALIAWWAWGKTKDPRPLILLGCAFVTFWMDAIFGGRLTHHAVLVVVFLVMAAAILLERLPIVPLLVVSLVVGGYWLSIVARLPQAEVYANTNKAKDRFIRQIEPLGNTSTAQVNFSWGTYYITDLFDPKNQETLYFNLDVSPINQVVPELHLLKNDGVKNILVVAEKDDYTAVYPAVSKAFGPSQRIYQQDNWSARLYKLSAQ